MGCKRYNTLHRQQVKIYAYCRFVEQICNTTDQQSASGGERGVNNILVGH